MSFGVYPKMEFHNKGFSCVVSSLFDAFCLNVHKNGKKIQLIYFLLSTDDKNQYLQILNYDQEP